MKLPDVHSVLNKRDSWGAPVNYRCSVCCDGGAVMARAKEQAREQFGSAMYAFKCPCMSGRLDRRAYPQWADYAGAFQSIR